MDFTIDSMIDTSPNICYGCELVHVNTFDKNRATYVKICEDPECEAYKNTYRVKLNDTIYVQFAS
jgi:hypothetical protein